MTPMAIRWAVHAITLALLAIAFQGTVTGLVMAFLSAGAMLGLVVTRR